MNYCNKTLKEKKKHDLNKFPRPPVLSTVRNVNWLFLYFCSQILLFTFVSLVYKLNKLGRENKPIQFNIYILFFRAAWHTLSFLSNLVVGDKLPIVHIFVPLSLLLCIKLLIPVLGTFLSTIIHFIMTEMNTQQ